MALHVATAEHEAADGLGLAISRRKLKRAKRNAYALRRLPESSAAEELLTDTLLEDLAAIPGAPSADPSPEPSRQEPKEAKAEQPAEGIGPAGSNCDNRPDCKAGGKHGPNHSQPRIATADKRYSNACSF